MPHPTDLSLLDEIDGEYDLLEEALGQDIVSQARSKLDRHTYLRSRSDSIGIDFTEGRLVLIGRLPSFYLKQMLQTTLRGLPGVRRIDNRVNVVSSTGLSSAKYFSNREQPV